MTIKTIAVLLLALSAAPVRADEADKNKTLQDEIQTLKKRLDEVEKAALGKTAADPTPAPAAKPAPFDFADFTWLNGNSRVSKPLIDNQYFTGQFMLDANYVYDYNHPQDHTLDGSSEVGRTNEFQVQQLGIGGDLHYEHIRGRVMTQLGVYSQLTPRNDSSPARGQWNLNNAYQYLSEANGGYHWDVLSGVNLDAGIFMSYVGLFSYYNNENWAYQPSYVSANTPWYFNGLRLQVFPTDKLKIEPWLVNGWQTYGMFNSHPGLGLQILWRPTGWFSILSNSYYGYDTNGLYTGGIALASRTRYHSDDSVEIKYYDVPNNFVDKSAFSFTFDIGCESGGGVACTGSQKNGPKMQNFVGFMLYNRTWFYHDRFGLTLGGGAINNPGRYLVLLPPINGATATSGTNYFTTNPGDPFKAWDFSATFDYMPSQYITWRTELDRRGSDVPYFVGGGGITPIGGNTGAPGSVVAGFTPDLKTTETRINLALLIRL